MVGTRSYLLVNKIDCKKMIYTSENDWYQWQYDNLSFERSTSSDQKFSTVFTRSSKSVGSFKQSVIDNSSSILDHYPGMRPCVMFSGGADSDVALRTFKELGANPIAYIFKYEDNINAYDVEYALQIVKGLNVDYKIVDFRLKSFFTNDAEKISEIAQVDQAQALPQLKFMDYVDGLAIYAASDPSWFRVDDNYSTRSGWLMRCWEHDIGWSKYIKTLNRPAVMEWWKWTPELVLAFTKTEWFNKLINDQYYGKLGINSTKIIGYREAFPNLVLRGKKTGFESCMNLITEFENFLSDKNNGLIFRRYYDRSLEDLHISLV
jgi:hypothetical protein